MAIAFECISDLLAQVADGDRLAWAMTEDADYGALSAAGRSLVDHIRAYNAEYAECGGSVRLEFVQKGFLSGSAHNRRGGRSGKSPWWWVVNVTDGDRLLCEISPDSRTWF